FECGVSVVFFQAEDGIRDRNVTGVQTCALPISATARWATTSSPLAHERGSRLLVVAHRAVAGDAPVPELAPDQISVQIGPEQHALLEDLLVQARTVEPGLEGEADVGGHRLVARGGHEGLLPVPLVE